MSTPTSEAHDAELMAALYLSQCFPEVNTLYRYGGWASTASMLADIVSDILKADIQTIVECGSGLTTVYSAAMLRRLGRGKVYALEHSETYRDQTNLLLEMNDLSAYAEVIDAPLETQTVLGIKADWYSRNNLATEVCANAQMIIIDGPPQVRGKLSRLGAISLIREAPKPLMVYIDDCHTKDTQEVLRRWREAGTTYTATFPTPDTENHKRLAVGSSRTSEHRLRDETVFSYTAQGRDVVLSGAVENGAETGGKAFLALFTYYDENSQPIQGPYPGLHPSRFGYYRYVAGGSSESPAEFSIVLSLPESVAEVEVAFSKYQHDEPIRLPARPKLTVP